MKISHSFDPRFTSLLKTLQETYSEEFFKLNGLSKEMLDINAYSKTFFGKPHANKVTADMSVDPNANVGGKDTITFNYEMPKALMKLNSLYNLWKLIEEEQDAEFADAVIGSVISGGIYINDVWDIGRPYCFNYSMYDVAKNGLTGIGRRTMTAPKSLSSFLHQVEQFTVFAANMTLGATGLADLIIVASWFVDRIKETGKDHKIHIGTADTFVQTYVKEMFAHLLYTLNFEFRGNQSPFTNVSIYDDYFLMQLLPSYELNGVAPKMETVKQVQKLFLMVYNDELKREALTFPVVTLCFSTEVKEGERKIKDQDFLSMCAELNLPYGAFNFYMGETSTLSSCCRLRSSISDLGYANNFGAGGTKIGSLGVVTVNLPRLAYLAEDIEDFLADVESVAVTCAIINNAKRTFIKDRIRRGALPLYDLGFMDIDKQYSTCGFTGLYEALEILGFDFADNKKEGMEIATKILNTINDVNEKMTKHYKAPHNMEQVPGESSAVKLATFDRLLGLNEDYELYSNQFCPLWHEDYDILTRLEIQGAFDGLCTGGAICHLNVENVITNKEVMASIVNYACGCGVVYFAINYKILKCRNSHVTAGKDGKAPCSVCGAPITDEYTRVVGFLTNTKNWNRTRREHDYPNRTFAQAEV